jgi:hypothetical protein
MKTLYLIKFDDNSYYRDPAFGPNQTTDKKFEAWHTPHQQLARYVGHGFLKCCELEGEPVPMFRLEAV